MFMSVTASTRRAASSYRPWTPHPYQERASEFLQRQGAAALFLDPGLGKTSVALDAFSKLQKAGKASKMLVVAPLRVVQTVWRQESGKWEQFRHLRYSVLHGPKKGDRLEADADIWLINPEGVAWLVKQYQFKPLPWDTVVIDELTKFKNHKAHRVKLLRPKLKTVKRRWGLTGTPIPNGYLDLFGQFLMLDDGAALGKYVSHYRDMYFQKDYSGFNYDLQPGADKRIEARIAPYVLRMAKEDYLDLPPLVDDVRDVNLDKAALKIYHKMKQDMLAELPEGEVIAANAAAVYSKLKQMANGAVYLTEEPHAKRGKAHIHDFKIEALEELIEELCGAPLLVAYEFNHDLARLRKVLGDEVPYLGAGVSAKQAQATVDAWNRGEIPVLLAHPASAGHGLNLQGSGASHICWFGPILDLELYEQFIQRVHRQGTTAEHIVNHILIAKGTIDELVRDTLRDKGKTQDKMLRALNTEILRDADTPAAGDAAVPEKETVMPITKISRKSDNGGVKRTAIPGWPGASEAEEVEDSPQRERVINKISAKEPEGETVDAAKALFSRGIAAQLNGDEDAAEEKPAPAKRTRRTKTKPVETAEPVTNGLDVDYDKLATSVLAALVKLALK